MWKPYTHQNRQPVKVPADPVAPVPDSPDRDVIVHVFGHTDVGRTREHNEDSFVIVDLGNDDASRPEATRTHRIGPRGALFMVADGLGGAAAGEVASELAVNTVHEELRERWVRAGGRGPDDFAAAIKAAAETANGRIFAYAVEHPESRGLGTTATMAGLLEDTLYLAQVGDSRAYLVRDGVARQITRDQSLMQRLVDAGELTQDEADRSERRNIILQALGPEPSVKIDLTHQRLSRGDVLVLCTDGLSGLVKTEEIAEVITQIPDLADACRELVDRANEQGGPDNITVIAARFEGEGLSVAEQGDHVGHAVYRLPGSETPTEPHGEFVPRDRGKGTRASRESGSAESTHASGSRIWTMLLLTIVLVAALLLAVREMHDGSPAEGAETQVQSR
jgi:Serine/threonine protein phosphatase